MTETVLKTANDPDSARNKEPKVLVLATSLNPESRSQELAREAARRLKASGVAATLVDLRETELPLAGTEASWSDARVTALAEKLAGTTHILFAVPIYNWDVNAAAKNAVELLGSDIFEDRTVGFICTAGGRSSFASVMPFANSLMLDFRSWIVPRFLYVTDGDLAGGLKPEISRRLDQLLADLLSRHPAAPIAQ